MNLDLLCPTPVVEGERVRLEPLTVDVLDPYLAMVNDPESGRLTGTHRSFERAETRAWLESRTHAPGRADWSIVAAEDSSFVGEVVLFDLDPDNGSGGFRISLAGPHVYGRGYGGAATQMVVEFALEHVHLHRLALEVYDFNDRAIATYRRAGFVEEGRLRDALHWDGQWYDALVMSVLTRDPRPRATISVR